MSLDHADFALQQTGRRQIKGPLFLEYGIMAHIPRPLSQSNPWNCIIQ